MSADSQQRSPRGIFLVLGIAMLVPLGWLAGEQLGWRGVEPERRAVRVATEDESLFPPPPSPRELAEPHLARAAEASEQALARHLAGVQEFLNESKRGSRPFAEAALGLGSKLRLAADFVPLTRGDRHAQFLRRSFEEHIFTPERLERVVTSAVVGYLAELRSIESRMLVDLRADVADFPETYGLGQWDDAALKVRYEAALAEVFQHSQHELHPELAADLVSLITGEVLTQVAVRMGVSAGLLGAGASSTWITFGVGAVVALVVDQIIAWVWDWYADPRGQLSARIDERLDEIGRWIVEGEGERSGLRGELLNVGRVRAQQRSAAIYRLLELP